MEGDYENASDIKPPAYTETFDTIPQVMQQPVSVPERKEVNSNSNVNAGNYDTPTQWMRQPATISIKSQLEKNSHMQGNSQVTASSGATSKSNAQGEGTTVLLQFNEIWTAPGIMMIINMVSNKAATQRS